MPIICGPGISPTTPPLDTPRARGRVWCTVRTPPLRLHTLTQVELGLVRVLLLDLLLEGVPRMPMAMPMPQVL